MTARDDLVTVLAGELAEAVHATVPLTGWAGRLVDDMIAAGWTPPSEEES